MILNNCHKYIIAMKKQLIYGSTGGILIIVILVIAMMPQVPDDVYDYGPAPDFTLENYDHTSVVFSEAVNKVKILSWTYTHCTQGCGVITLKMLNLFYQLQSQGKEEQVRFYDINFDYMHDNHSTVENYAKSFLADDIIPENFYFLVGNKSSIRTTADAWGYDFVFDNTTQNSAHSGHSIVWIHPFITYIIDKNGIIRAKIFGLEWTESHLLDIVDYLLGE